MERDQHKEIAYANQKSQEECQAILEWICDQYGLYPEKINGEWVQINRKI